MARITKTLLIIILLMSMNTPVVSHPVSLCTWNSRGMCAAVPYLRELTSRHEFIFVTEHWLHSNRLSKFREISDNICSWGKSSKYSDAEYYGSVRGQGGVAVLWDKTLGGVTPLNHITHDRICGVRWENAKGAICNLFCVYLPAKGNEESFEQVVDELSAILDSTEDGSYNIICGDLNADLGKAGGPRGTKKPCRQSRYLMQFITRHNLYATNLAAEATGELNTFSSTNGESCIDYILFPTDMRNNVLACNTEPQAPLNTSDHNPVTVKVMMNNIMGNTIKVETCHKLRWDKLKPEDTYKKYTVPLNNSLNEVYNKVKDKDPSPELIDKILDETIAALKLAEKKIPVSRYKSNLKPYWCPALSTLKKVKVEAYRIWVAAGRPRQKGNQLLIEHKAAEKEFRRKLKCLEKEYEDEKILKASQSAECDKNYFWRLIKKEKSGDRSSFTAIKNAGGKAVYKLEQVLDVWADHFDKLSTPKQSADYDKLHYDMVNNEVARLLRSDSTDNFTKDFFNEDEVRKCISKLNAKKSPGYDGITKEHLVPAGEMLPKILTLIFKWIFIIEYIPVNFRTGVQVPLHKGKNTSILDTNNFRGITLLSTFNKVFEMLIWTRMKEWWYGNEIISTLQGACRPGFSCVHTALLMQETISEQIERHKKVYVAYFDVSKAFDGIWINGLFYRLFRLGIQGKTWRLLYKCYINFNARVRIHNRMSRSYGMQCGIHQGGYLSLMKYIAFIDSLITELETSKLCCSISGFNTTPLGYADDMATATISKISMDGVFNIAHLHSRKWRYDFNAKKCAVVVYGESEKENKTNMKHRVYRLGKEIVRERDEYEHLGLMTFNKKDCSERTYDKVGKGRRALSAASGIGLKHGGVTTKACNIIFWSMIVPTVTFAAELWILSETDIRILEDFQKYAGRRVQRLHSRAPKMMSYVTLGWIRLENFINVKKLLFIRTLIVLKDGIVHKEVFRYRLKQFINNPIVCIKNEHNSPIFEMLRVAYIYDVFNDIVKMTNGTHYFSKEGWSRTVWENAWLVEDTDWDIRIRYFEITKLYKDIEEGPKYSIWWAIADENPGIIRQCETMIKLICGASKLKIDDQRIKNDGVLCSNCENYANEDARHVIMQCNGTEHIRREMTTMIEEKIGITYYSKIKATGDLFNVMMGKRCIEIPTEIMSKFWAITCIYVSKMYWSAINNRRGIG